MYAVKRAYIEWRAILSQTGKTEFAGGWKNRELRDRMNLRPLASVRYCPICKMKLPL